jgi:hypothetical protein
MLPIVYGPMNYNEGLVQILKNTYQQREIIILSKEDYYCTIACAAAAALTHKTTLSAI